MKRQPSEWEKTIANDQGIDFQNIQAAHATQYQKKKKSNQKMGKRSEWMFL